MPQSVPSHVTNTANSLLHARPGWPDTVGRRCSRRKGDGVSAAERRSCKTLCRDCNLSVDRNVSKVVAPCHCFFQWCCTVKCDTCLKRKVALTCGDRRISAAADIAN